MTDNESARLNGGPATVALIALEGKRQDDLRLAESRRQDDLRLMADAHRIELGVAEKQRLDAVHLAEKERIDSVIAADRASVGLASARAELTATALRETVDVSASTLAAQVDTTATATKTTADASTAALVGRIAPLERAIIEIAAAKVQVQETRVQSNWSQGQLIAVGLGLLAFGALIFQMLASAVVR